MKRTLLRRSPMKRGRKPMNRVGPVGRENAKAAAIQYPAFRSEDITWCELCGMTSGKKSMAHFRKRSKGLSNDELVYLVAYLHDVPCHKNLDEGPADMMLKTICEIIVKRDASGPFFDRARELAQEKLDSVNLDTVLQ